MQAVCNTFQISSRKMLYDWIKKGGDERAEMFRQARHLSADAHAEKAGDALNALGGTGFITGPEVTLAIGLSKYQQWLASVRDRDTYGANDGTKVQINIGQLHLEALQAVGAADMLQLPEETPEADFTVVEGQDDEADALQGDKPGPIVPPEAPLGLSDELRELL